MEEDIIKGANDYYHLAEKYDKKINNIVNRYENRTNQLFMDLRNREVEHRMLCNKIDCLIRRTADAPHIITKTLTRCIDIRRIPYIFIRSL